jgi:hypothetical protein
VDRAVLGGAADLFLRHRAANAKPRIDTGQHQLCLGIELYGSPNVDASLRLVRQFDVRATAFCLCARTFFNDALDAESLLMHAAEQRP